MLTLEPHLQVFEGLDSLEAKDDKTVIPDGMYPSHEASFKAAADALFAILARIGETEK